MQKPSNEYFDIAIAISTYQLNKKTSILLPSNWRKRTKIWRDCVVILKCVKGLLRSKIKYIHEIQTRQPYFDFFILPSQIDGVRQHISSYFARILLKLTRRFEYKSYFCREKFNQFFQSYSCFTRIVWRTIDKVIISLKFFIYNVLICLNRRKKRPYLPLINCNSDL